MYHLCTTVVFSVPYLLISMGTSYGLFFPPQYFLRRLKEIKKSALIVYISFTTSARVECEERAGILRVKMGTDDPAFDAPRRRRDDHRSFRQKLLVFFAFLAVVCTSFVLFYDFDDTDDGSKSAPPSQSSSSSGRKLGPVNGNEKGDGNVFGHSLVKGEDEVVEKIEFWPERFGKKKRVNWRRFALESMFEYSEDLRLLPKLAIPYGLNESARHAEEEKRREMMHGSTKKSKKKSSDAKKSNTDRITRKEYKRFISMYGNEGLKLAARRAFQFLKLRGSVGDEEAFVNKEHFLEMVLEEVGDNGREASRMESVLNEGGSSAIGRAFKLTNETRQLLLQRNEKRSSKISGCAISLHAGDHTHVKIDRSQSLHFSGTKHMTIETWVKPRKSKDFGGTIIAKYNRGIVGQFFVHVEQNGAVFFHREVAPFGLRSSVRLPADDWSHVAVTYGGGYSKMFINGTLRGAQEEKGQGWDAQTPITIGAILDHGNAASIFNGEIDEVRIWGIDRSQIDIENSMHGKLHGFERGLMGSWSFDECAGLKTRDIQGRRDAQLHGGRWVRSSLVLFSHEDEERARCERETPGKCSKAHLEKRREFQNEEYWRRSIDVLEAQAKLNKDIGEEMPKVQQLLDRVKRLEFRDYRRGEVIVNIEKNNQNHTQDLADLHNVLKAHEEQVQEMMEEGTSRVKRKKKKVHLFNASKVCDDPEDPECDDDWDFLDPVEKLLRQIANATRQDVELSKKIKRRDRLARKKLREEEETRDVFKRASVQAYTERHKKLNVAGGKPLLKRKRTDSDVLTENDLKMVTYEKREANTATGMQDVEDARDFEDVMAGTISSAGKAIEVDDLNDDEDWIFDDESDNEISFGDDDSSDAVENPDDEKSAVKNILRRVEKRGKEMKELQRRKQREQRLKMLQDASEEQLELEAENEAENIVKNLFNMREVRKKLKDPTNSLSDD